MKMQIGTMTWKKKSDKTFVIMNASHSLLDDQKNILKKQFKDYDLVSVPLDGWTLSDMDKMIDKLRGSTVIFVSPIPYMIKRLSYYQGYAHPDHCLINGPLVGLDTIVHVFHNDSRIKKTLPDGRVIMTVAPTGWQLV